jgi:circadian clock protein KaiC
MAETPLRYRRQLLMLKQQFAKMKSTVLLLDDRMDKQAVIDPHVLSLTQGVLEMEQLSPDYGTSRRRLRISKLRAVKFREGYHDYIIATGGLRVFPRMIAAEHHTKFRHEPVSSGIKQLDSLCGGGLDRGTTTLILGPAGTGKSTLVLQYAVQMAKKGECSIIFAFDETRSVMLSRAKALGFKLEKAIARGTITVHKVDPAELSPGEFAVRILRGVEAGYKLVAIDSLNGYLNAMPGEKYLNNQLHELSSYLNQQGVITLLVLAQHGLLAAAEAPVDLSYLSDTVVSLRYFEAYGEVKQAIAMFKKRSGRHERTIREFKLRPGKGITVGETLRVSRCADGCACLPWQRKANHEVPLTRHDAIALRLCFSRANERRPLNHPLAANLHHVATAQRRAGDYHRASRPGCRGHGGGAQERRF